MKFYDKTGSTHKRYIGALISNIFKKGYRTTRYTNYAASYQCDDTEEVHMDDGSQPEEYPGADYQEMPGAELDESVNPAPEECVAPVQQEESTTQHLDPAMKARWNSIEDAAKEAEQGIS